MKMVPNAVLNQPTSPLHREGLGDIKETREQKGAEAFARPPSSYAIQRHLLLKQEAPIGM